jgi:TorA maturation chaperone TorD
LSIREELAHQGKIPVDQICQILQRIKNLTEIQPDKSLEDLLDEKLIKWSVCRFAD